MTRTFINTPAPTPAEIDAAIERAHALRSEAFGNHFGALYRAVKGLFVSGQSVPTGANLAR